MLQVKEYQYLLCLLFHAQVITTKDRMEGIKAFNEKRQPQYTGE